MRTLRQTFMHSFMRAFLIPALAPVVLATTACNDFLTAGDASRDPNRPSSATIQQYFVAVQSNLWALHTGHLSRVSAAWSRQLVLDHDIYRTYNMQALGMHTAIYSSGGLIDARNVQRLARERADSVYLGIAQVQEAMFMGLAADVFGDVVYSEAYGPSNPHLDSQFDVYDSVQAVLARAIDNLEGGGAGPGDADLVYGGDPAQWIKLANTLRARYYLHAGEQRPDAYASAMTFAPKGILSATDNYRPAFTGTTGQSSLWSQFLASRSIEPDPFFDSLLVERNDPRRTEYFQVVDDTALALSTARRSPQYGQAMASAVETRLIWAEAAQRVGQNDVARQQLDSARALVGLSPVSSTLTGDALRAEILLEKYIASFQLGVEVWMQYRRTCAPNLSPGGVGTTIPGRLFYDDTERATNANIPEPGTAPNGTRNRADAVNSVSDLTGEACVGGA